MAATTVYGPYKQPSGNLFEFRPWFTYEVTTNNTTTYTVTLTAGIQVGNNNGSVGVNGMVFGASGTGQTLKQNTSFNFYTTEINGSNTVFTTWTWSWTKGHSTQSIELASAVVKSGYLEQTRGSVTLSVPAKTSYTVKYSANGGSGAPSTQTKWYGESLKLSTAKPTRTGYTFLYWSGSNGTNYDPGDTVASNVNTNLTLTAQWQLITYTIKYNNNGGSGTISNQTKNYGTPITLSGGSGFNRTNYELTGWNTKANGTGTAYAKSGSYSANASVTLYAQWSLNYVNPVISSLKAVRVDSGGTEDDEGTYIKVTFNYTGGKLGGTLVEPKCLITIDGTPVRSNTAIGGTSGTFTATYGSAYSADTTHAVVVTLSDSNGGNVSATKTVATATYPLDFKASGTNLYMGVMTPAESRKLTLAAFRAKGTSYTEGGNFYANQTDGSTTTLIGCQQSGTTAIRMAAQANGHNGIYNNTNSRWLIVDYKDGDLYVGGTSSTGINMTPSQAANTVLAAPNGSTGKPTWRALVAADIPNLGAAKITSGTLGVARLPNMLQTKAYSYEKTTSTAAGASVAITGTNFAVSTPSNYKPVGIAYFATSNSNILVRGANATVTGSSSMMYVTNISSSAVASFTAYITILYAYTGTVA